MTSHQMIVSVATELAARLLDGRELHLGSASLHQFWGLLNLFELDLNLFLPLRSLRNEHIGHWIDRGDGTGFFPH